MATPAAPQVAQGKRGRVIDLALYLHLSVRMQCLSCSPGGIGGRDQYASVGAATYSRRVSSPAIRGRWSHFLSEYEDIEQTPRGSRSYLPVSSLYSYTSLNSLSPSDHQLSSFGWTLCSSTTRQILPLGAVIRTLSAPLSAHLLGHRYSGLLEQAR